LAFGISFAFTKTCLGYFQKNAIVTSLLVTEGTPFLLIYA